MKNTLIVQSLDKQLVNLGDENFFQIVSSGIDNFDGEKDYISTKCVQGDKIIGIECKVTIRNRPSRANMQPSLDTVWFAKMKDTNKVYFFDEFKKDEIKKYLFSTGFVGIKVNIEKVLPKYLKYLFETKSFNDIKNSMSFGGTQKAINLQYVRKIKVPLPSIETQKSIIKILDRANILLSLREKANASIEKLVSEVFYSMFGDTSNNNQRWPVKRITEICSKEKNAIKAGPFGSMLKKEFYVKKGYKIYGQEQVIIDDFNFGDYYINAEKYKELQNYRIQARDVLISLVGTYGKISIVPEKFEKGIINPRLIKITLDKDLIDPIYFKYLFLSQGIFSEIKSKSHGGTMGIINLKILKDIDFPVPPIELQKKFTFKLNKIL